MHTIADAALPHLGAFVVLVASENPDGSTDLSSSTSLWWLGRRGMLGLTAGSRAATNILRTGQAVLNLPSAALRDSVGRLADRGAGSSPAAVGLTPLAAQQVRPARIRECPVQIEVELAARCDLAADDAQHGGKLIALELRIVRVHVDARIRAAGPGDRIDAARWRPLVMSFCELSGAGHRLEPSRMLGVHEGRRRPSAGPAMPEKESGPVRQLAVTG